ncbi:hypothetical protein [Carboxylicivirga linearis]|uniref:Uncharacterized protein n=1 Tax=Carboxylicivirga linearis TaxID=1628157 RepID=A0ABS5K0Q5_9BACT|nr:hypothetical protein [Carboxylicivirga linearis]MBS2100709.1 hypothetical protein [Carboxylicivirga linearis]
MEKKEQTVAQLIVNQPEGQKLPDGVTADMITAWKNRYGEGKIKLGEIPMDEERTQFLAVIGRVPCRKSMGEFEKWMDKDPNKSKEILINSCLLTEKEKVKADDLLFYGAFDFLSQLIPIGKATIKNL